MAARHECDEACVCPLCGSVLFYNRDWGLHACANDRCKNKHGLRVVPPLPRHAYEW